MHVGKVPIVMKKPPKGGPRIVPIPISQTGKPHVHWVLRKALPQEWRIINPRKHCSGPAYRILTVRVKGIKL